LRTSRSPKRSPVGFGTRTFRGPRGDPLFFKIFFLKFWFPFLRSFSRKHPAISIPRFTPVVAHTRSTSRSPPAFSRKISVATTFTQFPPVPLGGFFLFQAGASSSPFMQNVSALLLRMGAPPEGADVSTGSFSRMIVFWRLFFFRMRSRGNLFFCVLLHLEILRLWRTSRHYTWKSGYVLGAVSSTWVSPPCRCGACQRGARCPPRRVFFFVPSCLVFGGVSLRLSLLFMRHPVPGTLFCLLGLFVFGVRVLLWSLPFALSALSGVCQYPFPLANDQSGSLFGMFVITSFAVSLCHRPPPFMVFLLLWSGGGFCFSSRPYRTDGSLIFLSSPYPRLISFPGASFPFEAFSTPCSL